MAGRAYVDIPIGLSIACYAKLILAGTRLDPVIKWKVRIFLLTDPLSFPIF